jgi:hypothetical protein
VSGVRLLLAAIAVAASFGSVSASAAAAEPAAAEHWFAVPVSSANDGSASSSAAGFLGAAADGSAVYFATSDQVLPDEDGDSSGDIYVRRGAALELASGPAAGAADSGAGGVSPRKVSADGSTVVFQTSDSLAPEDTDDGETDLYEHSGGVTRLVSVPDPALVPGFDFPFFGPLVDLSPDGRLVAFSTSAVLSPADTDSSNDVYVYDRTSGATSLASDGISGNVALLRLGGGRVFMQSGDIYSYDTADKTTLLWTRGTTDTPQFSYVSPDGSHLFFETTERLSASDNDGGERDVYQSVGGVITLVSTAPGYADGIDSSGFQKSSADGSIVYFTTFDQLSSDDTDGGTNDLYRRLANGSVELVSQGPAETLTYFNPIFSDVSADGQHAFFWTSQDLTEDDSDGGFSDAYERFDGVTTRLSVGEQNDQGFDDASFAGFASGDLTRRFFQTAGQMTTEDTDGFEDLYSRHDGRTALVSTGAPPSCTLLPSTRCEPIWHGTSADGHRVWFESDEPYAASDSDSDATDVWESRLAAPGSVSDSLVVSDPYDDVLSAEVKVSGFAAGDSLSYGGAIPGSLNSAGDTLTLTGRGTDADYQAALRAVSFSPGSVPGIRTLAYRIDNGSGAGAAGVKTLVVPEPAKPSETGTEPRPGLPPDPDQPNPPGPPLLHIRDTGDWVAHLRAKRMFRVPGLVLYCPGRAAAACEASVDVPGAGASGTLNVPPGETRGLKLRASRAAARRARRHGRLHLRASATYTLPGSAPVTATKRFRLLAHR